VAAVRWKAPFITVPVCAENPRRINATKGTMVLNTCTGRLIEEAFACGEPV
jgi:hypothetical protein